MKRKFRFDRDSLFFSIQFYPLDWSCYFWRQEAEIGIGFGPFIFNIGIPFWLDELDPDIDPTNLVVADFKNGVYFSGLDDLEDDDYLDEDEEFDDYPDGSMR